VSEKQLGVTDTIALGLRKRDDETWLDAALRMAKPWGLEHEIRTWYGYAIENGRPEDEAAWDACYEWDVLELRTRRNP